MGSTINLDNRTTVQEIERLLNDPAYWAAWTEQFRGVDLDAKTRWPRELTEPFKSINSILTSDDSEGSKSR